jgi:acetyl esterase
MAKMIDRAMARILALGAPAVDFRAMPVAEARQLFLDQRMPPEPVPHPLAAIRPLDIPGPAGAMPARLYLPEGAGPRPVVVFVHGGGWTFGNMDTHGPLMHWLAARSGWAVLGFEYRLAPEHPYPAGHEDTLAALAFVRAGQLGPECDAARMALAGDSAGANLALGAMLALRDAGLPQVATAALFYGCYAPLFETESNRENGQDYGLTTEMMRWYWANFLGGTVEDPPAYAAPLLADLTGLPPLYLDAAGLDPLLDDTTLLSARLARAGVRHRVDIWPGVVHGFLRFQRDLPIAQAALEAAAEHLRASA